MWRPFYVVRQTIAFGRCERQARSFRAGAQFPVIFPQGPDGEVPSFFVSRDIRHAGTASCNGTTLPIGGLMMRSISAANLRRASDFSGKYS